MTNTIPLLLQVDPSNFPPGPVGPRGSGIVARQWSASFPSGQNTLSQDFVASGVCLDVEALATDDKFEIDITGVTGSSFTTGTHVPLVVARNGVFLLGPGETSHAAPFVGTNSQVGQFSISMTDSPGIIGSVRYEMWFKSFAGAASLGRRGSDLMFSIPTSMRVRRMVAP